MNAIHTKEPLLTSHLQSPPGHRQDRSNKPGSETPIVQNLPLATGYHYSLWLCKIKDLDAGGLGLEAVKRGRGKKRKEKNPLTRCCSSVHSE
uniref:Uncharacterized protein n=1 Tax=Castor canadensis TaxID=51338 RepID=A0A8C0X906_CASCN